MKPKTEVNHFSRKLGRFLSCASIIAGILLCSGIVIAQLGPGSGGPTNVVLQSWSFSDPTNWTDDANYAPKSFTNISFSTLGNGQSLVVDTNIPAWLQYNVVENDGTTNLTVNSGTLTLWFAPGSWSSTNGGLGDWGQLIDVGEWTTNSSYGYWGLSVDPVGENLWFVSQDGVGNTYTLSTPISWTTNYFHFIALTYCATNTALYLDGVLATNDPGGLGFWPGSEVLSNGVFFGSDTNGQMQAHGLFNTVITYNYPLDSNDISANYQWEFSYNDYQINPDNFAMNGSFSPAPSSPSYTPQYDVITGSGNLQDDGTAPNCVDGTSAYDVWITNVVARLSGSGSNNLSLTFTIEGGAANVPYDVFVNNQLSFGTNGVPWVWMGQGYQCHTYTLTILSNSVCFLILGTPLDTTGSGLTDAYEGLVMKVNPEGTQTDSYGVPYAWYAEQALTPFSTGLGGQDPDADGLLNYQEYEYGTMPLHNEGLAIWVNEPGTASELP